MNTNKKIIYVLILPFLCITVLPQIPISGHFENRQVPVPDAAYTPHAPIEIDGDGALATFCSGSGTGTESDPYIIEGYSISGGIYGIHINGTNAYVCVRNNKLNDQGWACICVEGAQNVNVSGNDLGKSGADAVRISGCQNMEISGNTITTTLHGKGIDCASSSNVKIRSNNIKSDYRDGSGFGIIISDMNICEISANTIDNCSTGFSIGYNCANLQVKNNQFILTGMTFPNWESTTLNWSIDTSNKVNGKSVRCYERQTGISVIDETDIGQLFLINVNNSQFSGLNVSLTTIGVKCINCHNNTFSDILALQVRRYCFLLANSTHNLITKSKTSFSNTGFILTDESTNNTIAENLIFNHGAGVASYSGGNIVWGNSFKGLGQYTRPEPYNNTWDNGEKGNYWEDYRRQNFGASNDGIIWNTPYTVVSYNGQVELDHFPLVNDPFPMEEPEEEEPEINGFPLAMFGIVSVITLIIKRKRIEA